MKKVQANASAALQGLLRDNMTIAAGGFGLWAFRKPHPGVVRKRRQGPDHRSTRGRGRFRHGLLLKSRQVKKVIAS